MTDHPIRLTKTDLDAIEYEVHLLTGSEPTLEQLESEGIRENPALNKVLETITSAGRIMTLLTAELIQSLAALIIAVMFGLLEYYRVAHGATALGQEASQAALIALAVVTANIVHPIYSLRQLRGQSSVTIVKMTGAGYVAAFWRRLMGKPLIETADLYYNPTLHRAASVITWSTVLLAVYDILGPLLTQLFTGNLVHPLPILLMELLMGLGLSIAGVFFLQSAAHEIGVRTLTDQPMRLANQLAERRLEYTARKNAIREEVRTRFMATKLAEQQRKAQPANPTSPASVPELIGPHPNGNGNGRGVDDRAHE